MGTFWPFFFRIIVLIFQAEREIDSYRDEEATFTIELQFFFVSKPKGPSRSKFLTQTSEKQRRHRMTFYHKLLHASVFQEITKNTMNKYMQQVGIDYRFELLLMILYLVSYVKIQVSFVLQMLLSFHEQQVLVVSSKM